MQTRIKECFERNRKALSLRPSIGRGTATTRVRLVEGLACEIEDGRWTMNVDLSAKSGGTGGAPDPGVYGRGALGSCLAIAYALWAAEAELPIDSLSVEIEADYDARGMYGVDGAIADYPEIRYRVILKSPAPDEEIEAVLADAEQHCNYLNVFTRAREIKRELRIDR
jgi:uncharacterized OsmC-like protein